MANELATKRIINLPAESAPASGDVFVVDNESTGTKKLPVTGMIDNTLTLMERAADSKEAGDAKDETDKNVTFLSKRGENEETIIFSANADNSNTYNRHLFHEFLCTPGKSYCVTIDFSNVTFRERNNNYVFRFSTASEASYNYLVDQIVEVTGTIAKRKITKCFTASAITGFFYMYCYTALNTAISINVSIQEVATAKSVLDEIGFATEQLTPVWFPKGTINKTTGQQETSTDDNWNFTQFYEIPDNAINIKLSVYAAGSSAGVAFYNNTETFISGTNITSKDNRDLIRCTIPDGAKYVRFTNFVGAAYHPDTPLIIFEIDKNATIIESKKEGDYKYLAWRKGININGAYATSDYRMCTVNPVIIDKPVRISLADNWRAWVSYYKNGVWIKDGVQSQYNGYVPEIGYEIYISLGKRDGSAITDEELATASQSIAIILNGEYEINQRLNQTSPDWASLSMFYKIGVLGDSFASGSLHHPDGSGSETNYNLSWGQILARDIGAMVTNYSKGGLSATTWLTNTEFGLDKLLSSDPEQLYICAFGINDWNQRNTYPIGTIADCKNDFSQNPATFYGSYGKVIGNIMTHSPSAKIILLSVMRETERQLDADIKTIAEHFGIPFIQVTDDNYFISEYYALSMFENHPVAYGYSGIAEALKRLLCKAVMNNVEYFSTYYGNY